MSKEREIIRLMHQGLSQRSIMAMLKVSDFKVRKVKKRLDELDLSYDNLKDMVDDDFQALFIERKEVKSLYRRSDCEYIHKELNRKGVTLMLLWEEYVEECTTLQEPYLKYTQFCNVYKNYVATNKLTMHIDRKPGERCEVDWAGTTIPLYDLALNKVIAKAYLFVGVLPFSQYMFAQASLDMKEEAWINHHIDMFNHFEGIPLICVCDNCKTAIISHKKYEEVIFNKAYYEMAEYYGIAVMPAHVRKPKYKNSTEATVGYLTTQIIARLRDEKFTSLRELNKRIYKEVEILNAKEFQKRDHSRTFVFEDEEKVYLLPLPKHPYEYAVWKAAVVNYNYHIQFERNYYSVPYQYLRKDVDLRITRNIIEIYYKQVRIASHPRILSGINKYITNEEHMPENHKMYGEWNSDRILNWAKQIGPNTYKVIWNIFNNARLEQQVYNQCITILKLRDKYSVSKLEAASEYILVNHITPIQNNFKMIIENIQVKQNIEQKENDYALLRGADYYGGYRND